MSGEGGDKQPQSARESDEVERPSSSHRVRAAWRTWLSALATDADAAIAAAMAYESLQPEARDAWLDALEGDASTLGVPAVALYAPLFAVESDGARRGRIAAAMAGDPLAHAASPPRALRGVATDGTHACAIIAPVYLDFVQILWCRFTPAAGFISVRHEPLRHIADQAPIAEVEGVTVEPTPLRIVVEELAHAILADRREHRAPPPALASFAYLFGPEIGEFEDADVPAR